MRTLVCLVLVVVLVLVTARATVPGVWSWSIGRCDVDMFARRALVLACPGRDYVRLWPWPIVSPWFEDEEKAPAQLATYL